MSNETNTEHEPRRDSAETRRNFFVAIFGASSDKKPHEKVAVELARDIARALTRDGGHPVLTGGYDVGVMDSATQAALAESKALGRPDLTPQAITLGDTVGQPSEGAVVEEKEHLIDRLKTLLEKSNAIVVLHGSMGTVVELVVSLWNKAVEEVRSTEKNLNFSDKPIIICDSSLEHTDLIYFLNGRDPKLAQTAFKHVYIISANSVNASAEVNRVIEDYYQKSIGKTPNAEESNWLEERSVTNFMLNKDNFVDGGGI